MKKEEKPMESSFFEKFAARVTKAAGSTGAFIGAVSVVVIWAISGPIFNYSETWQLVINTGTTIITFLMVFLIQKSQNKDSLAVHIKLNELVASHEIASNRMVDVESLTEAELEVLEQYYSELAKKAKNARNIKESHSIDEAEKNAARKKQDAVHKNNQSKNPPTKKAGVKRKTNGAA